MILFHGSLNSISEDQNLSHLLKIVSTEFSYNIPANCLYTSYQYFSLVYKQLQSMHSVLPKENTLVIIVSVAQGQVSKSVKSPMYNIVSKQIFHVFIPNFLPVQCTDGSLRNHNQTHTVKN